MKKQIIYLLFSIFLVTISIFIGKYSYIGFGDFGPKFIDIRVCNNMDRKILEIELNETWIRFFHIDSNKCSQYKKISLFILTNNHIKTVFENRQYKNILGPYKRHGIELSDIVLYGKYTIVIDKDKNDKVFHEIINDL